ncbi:MAG TPA: sulfotransferase [Rhizomicrobium sp.]|nr:sulfotransferase [Rhizomicrobium sp.]
MNTGRPPPQIIVEIDRAMRAGNMTEAARLATRALGGGMSHPILFTLRAGARRRDGDLGGALADLNAARKLNPRSANVLIGIADALNALGRHREAIAAARDALAIDRMLAAAWFQQGQAHQVLNELGAASAAFSEVVRIDPRQAEGWACLANLAALQGRNAEARSSGARSLSLEPGNATAKLALARADLAEGHQSEAEARLSELIASQRSAPELRAMALGYLGDIRDAQDHTAEAFEAYSQSGVLWLSLQEPRQSGHESATAQAARLTAAVAALPSEGWPRAAPVRSRFDDSHGIAFILGFPRTGTTLLAQILAGLPNIAVLEEKPVFAKAVQDFFTSRDGLARLALLSDAEIARYRDDVWQRIRETGIETRARLVLDQNALNTCYLPVILRLFPEAPVVFTLRDPRDVVFSCFRRQFGANVFTLEFHTPQRAAALYAAAMDLAQVCRERLGFRPFDIRNEDLAEDFDGQTRRLCEFLGLDWRESLRDFDAAARARTVATISSLQVRRGINRDGIGQWRRYRIQLAPMLPQLASFVERFGYGPD